MENNIVDLTLKVEDGGDGMFRGLVWDAESGSVLTTVFLQPGTSKVSIPAGHSCFLVHSFGCEASYVQEDSSFQEVMVTTNEADGITQELWASVLSVASPLTKADKSALIGQEVRWEPDMMWAGSFDGTLRHRKEGESLSLEVTARPLCVQRFVVLSDVFGLDFVANAEAFITGCASKRRVYDDACLGSCSIRIPVYRYEDGFLASFLSFGDTVDQGVPKMMLLVVTDTGGRKFLYSYDLTGAFDAGLVVERESGLTFVQPPVSEGGGLQPTLLDWNDVMTPIEI